MSIPLVDPQQRYDLLPGRVVARTPSLRYWFLNFKHKDAAVGFDVRGDVAVSTIFTGRPHASSKPNKVLVFETRVFGGALDGQTRHYATYVDAVAGHADTLDRVVNAARRAS